jgi:RNA polymerase sigma-70 factor (ECF subfamily)
VAKTDAELAQSTLRGDRRAFGIIVQRHQDAVFGLISRLIRRQSDVEDVAQEAFVRAYRALGTFRGDAQFGTWLYRIVYNTCLDRREQQVRRDEREMQVGTNEEDEDRLAAMPDTDSPLPDQVLEAQDMRSRLAAHIEALPPHFQAVLTLYYYEQKSYEEIAKILDQPLNTIKVHIHRAKAHLKKALLQDGEAEGWER